MNDDDDAVTRPAIASSLIRESAVGDVLVGTTVAGRYKLLRKLGQGGMGVVYLAEHVMIEKKVAVKLVTGDYGRKPDLVARFIQEAKAASRIGHENIIDITDCGETGNGSVFIAMEYLEGCDLAEVIAQTVHSSTRATGMAPLPLARVARIMNQVCRGLGAAHAKGIVHRDLKPSNIFLVQREGRPDVVKILDFGLAKMSSPGDGKGPRLTAAGTIFGTAEYMSPEQARGENADGRTDIYAAGCVLYQLLTGEVPFRAGSFMGLLRCHLEDPVKPLRERVPEAGLGEELEGVVQIALAKRRDERFQEMKDLALALCAATGGDPAQAWSEPGVVLPGGGGTAPGAITALAAPSLATLERAGAPAGRPSLARWVVLFTVAAASCAAFATTALVLRRRATTDTTTIAPAVTTVRSATGPTAAPAVTTGKSRVAIRSVPSEALVMRGPKEVLGETPLDLDLEASAPAFDVTIEKKGHLPQRLEVAPDRDREYVVRLTPRPTTTAPRPSVVEKKKAATTTTTRKNRELKDVFEE